MDESSREAYLEELRLELEARYGRPLSSTELAGLARAVEDQLGQAPAPGGYAAAPGEEAAAVGAPQKAGNQSGRAGRGLLGGIAGFAAAIAKLSIGGLKFASLFIAVGGYTLLWGWRFAVGFVSLILIHELGHVFEARRQGLAVSLPLFIPFFGAYVTHQRPADPFRGALIALSGPFWGGVGSTALWVVARASDSPLLSALAYTGFLLNLINLLPVGFLDGGHAWAAQKALRRGGPPGRGTVVLWMHAVLAGALVLGMLAAHVHQTRL